MRWGPVCGKLSLIYRLQYRQQFSGIRHMQSGQQEIISPVFEWRNQERPVWLCTILKTWGSSPRPVGSMMAATLDGEIAGSIPRGCAEVDFLEAPSDGRLSAQYGPAG